MERGSDGVIGESGKDRFHTVQLGRKPTQLDLKQI